MQNYKLPITIRALEGLTTTMLLGYWYAGGHLVSPLSFVYTIHWMASLRYHLYPSYRNCLLDQHFIDMVCMERLFSIYGSYWIYVIYLSTMWMNEVHPYICVLKVMSDVTFLFLLTTSYQHFLCFVIGGLLYLWSDLFSRQYCLYKKSLACIGFHVSMTTASYLEKQYYQYDQIPLNLFRNLVFFIYLHHALKYLF